MSRTGARRWRAAALAALSVLAVAACGGGGDSAAPPPTVPATVIPPSTTTTLVFTTLTSAPDISMGAASCQLSVQGSPAPEATITVALTSPLPLASISVDYRFGSVERMFAMRTSGSGIATHPLTIPKEAAGFELSLTATLTTSHATCSTGFFVP
ncbi:MAG: hypothetical protein ACRDZ8_03560 [Acidimicrobiales bacterium]